MAVNARGRAKQTIAQAVRKQEIQSKEELEQKPRTKAAEAVLFLSRRKQRAHHQKLPRREGNSLEDKKQGKPSTFITKTHQGSQPHLCFASTVAILPNLPKS